MGKKLHGNEYIEFTKNRILNTCEIDKNGCWIWKGYLLGPKKIYGLTTLAIDGPRKKFLSHRASYIIWNGKIPKNLQVLHCCDVPLCCNPEHLHLGTAQNNMDEMKERGRERKVFGVKNHKSKLNEDEVKEIRILYDQGKTLRQLQEIFGVKYNTIHYVTSRKTWKHI
jgi:hypothetical protein